MELNSLPDEMLAVILRRSEFENVMNLRKINNRLDDIAKRNQLDQIPVEEWNFNRCIILSKPVATYFGFTHTRLELLNRVDVEEILSTIQIQKKVELLTFDENILTAMRNNRKSLRKVSHLSLKPWESLLSKQVAKELLWAIFPKVNQLLTNQGSNEDFCNSEVLGNRKWKELCFDKTPFIPFMDDAHIQIDKHLIWELGPNCDKLFLICPRTSLTVADAIDLLKVCITDRRYNKCITLYGLSLGEIPPQNALKRIKELLEHKIQYKASINNGSFFNLYLDKTQFVN